MMDPVTSRHGGCWILGYARRKKGDDFIRFSVDIFRGDCYELG